MSNAESERKQVTVMFADITGFTALSERLDPEQVTETVNQFFALLSEPIKKYDGTIDRYMGDAVMVLFGAPRTHENDPERALLCALDMLSTFNAARKKISEGPALNLHLGINTGLVIAGQVGSDTKMEYTVIGDTVNLASRLKDNAPPGAIYVSETTFRLTSRIFDFRSVEPLHVKGKSDPIAAYVLDGVPSSAASARGIEGLRSPLVGRDDERVKLVGAINDLEKRGHGGIAFVVGEAGWGKSRLLSEVKDQTVASHSSDEKTLWLQGHGLAYAQNIAYFPIVDLFRSWLGLMGVPTAEDQKKYEDQLRDAFTPGLWIDIAPFFKKMLGLELDPVSAEKIKYLEADNAKRQLLYAIRQGVRTLAGKNRVVFVIDDLHWADESTIELLQYLVSLVDEVPILFIFVTRLEEGARALLSLRTWAREQYPTRFLQILLQPLSKKQSQELLSNLIGADNLSEELRKFVLTRAEGNPFYIEEVVRWLMDRGWIVREKGRWRVTSNLESPDLPPTLLGVIVARIDRLAPDLKETLQTAAVIGRTFSFGFLERIVSNPERLDEKLAKLQEIELIAKRQDPRRREYEFKHILTQGAAYESLLLRRRRELHGKVARVLEQFYGRRMEDQIAFIAYHYNNSDDTQRAIEYAAKSGENALGAYTPQEAIKFFREALARMENDRVHDDVQQARILLGLGDAENAEGDNAAAQLDWSRALDLVRAQNQIELIAGILRRMGTAAWAKGVTTTALKLYEEGLAALDRMPFSAERAALFHEMGRLHFRIGDNEQAIHWAKQALKYGERLNAHEAIAQAYNTLGIATARMGEIESGIEYVNKGLSVALEHDLLAAACRAYTNLGLLYAVVDHDKSAQYCKEGIALARKIGDLSYESWIQSALASNWCSLEGDWEQGISAARASIVLDGLLGQSAHLAVPLIVVAQIYQCHRENKQSEKYYREAQIIAEKAGDPQLLFPIYDGLASLNLENGNRRAADEYLEKGRQVAERTGYKSDTLLAIPFLS